MASSSSSAASGSSRLSRTGQYLRTEIWIWPILAAVVLLTLGIWMRSRLETVMLEDLGGELRTLLAADVQALRLWARSEKAIATTLAWDPELHSAVSNLVNTFTSDSLPPADPTRGTPARAKATARPA